MLKDLRLKVLERQKGYQLKNQDQNRLSFSGESMIVSQSCKGLTNGNKNAIIDRQKMYNNKAKSEFQKSERRQMRFSG